MSNYPAGSNNSDAPWNQPDAEPQDFYVTVQFWGEFYDKEEASGAFDNALRAAGFTKFQIEHVKTEDEL